ncbi:MAG TPA: inositol-3-phosphate synthase, partial [Polyangiaceae bacterium]|nr:inositol-3-phosphate synthase [Polyangiaceae bacterium]
MLLPGMGAVATTFIAGCMLARRKLAEPIGSLTQMGRIRLGKRTDNREPFLHEFVPLAKLDDLVFGGWDLFPDDAYTTARNAEVLTRDHLDQIKDELSAIKPMPAVFFPEFVKRLRGENVKK